MFFRLSRELPRPSGEGGGGGASSGEDDTELGGLCWEGGVSSSST